MTITLYIIGYILCGLLGAWISHSALDKRRFDTPRFVVFIMCVLGPLTLFVTSIVWAVISAKSGWKAFGKWMDAPAFRKRED